jgi:hypothetical protein
MEIMAFLFDFQRAISGHSADLRLILGHLLTFRNFDANENIDRVHFFGLRLILYDSRFFRIFGAIAYHDIF